MINYDELIVCLMYDKQAEKEALKDIKKEQGIVQMEAILEEAEVYYE